MVVTPHIGSPLLLVGVPKIKVICDTDRNITLDTSGEHLFPGVVAHAAVMAPAIPVTWIKHQDVALLLLALLGRSCSGEVMGQQLEASEGHPFSHGPEVNEGGWLSAQDETRAQRLFHLTPKEPYKHSPLPCQANGKRQSDITYNSSWHHWPRPGPNEAVLLNCWHRPITVQLGPILFYYYYFFLKSGSTFSELPEAHRLLEA